MDTLDQDIKNRLIQDGIAFMRSLTEAYGSDKGMQMWETISDTVDPSLKGDIFFAMITGNFNGYINVVGFESWSNKISAIKAVRTVDSRRLGLKEAKDYIEALEHSGRKFRLEINGSNRATAMRTLRDAGLIV